MRYRIACLTPLLVGDGRKLSPIDYMVWKDQVNVLDQYRIFSLLAKGPRLDSYLGQLKRAEKLDFASWGGFAQNFAGRRIQFEHSSCAAHWERARSEHLHIPTFFAGAGGPYLPGSALKGALRTGMLFGALREGALKRVAAQFQSDRPPRRPAEILDQGELGQNGSCRMRIFQAADSDPVPVSSMKIYLLRVSSLVSRGPQRYELGWKQSPRGTSDGKRPEEGTPFFAEMATPGTVFEGEWRESAYLSQPDVARALNWREAVSRRRLFEAVNRHTAELLAIHKQYAEWTGLSLLAGSIENLEARLNELRAGNDACLLSLGWGGGLLTKVSWLKTGEDVYREIIRQVPIYGRNIAPSLPFPKTRRIVFLENRPAVLPGFVTVEVA